MNYQEILEGINPTVRKSFYAIFALVGVVFGAAQVGYGAAEIPSPTWLIVSLAIYAFIGGTFGLTAATNTPRRVFGLDAEDELIESSDEVAPEDSELGK